MKTVKVKLEFPLARINEPVVTHLVRDFDVQPNVLAANIEAGRGGWILLELQGDDDRVDAALDWIGAIGITAPPQQ
jgi:ABC-type methionine transport system ATPase subunit